MASRTETAAATRHRLLTAAGELLDGGGRTAVTLREVGARAEVSRSAPYRHFANKESLLTTLAIQAWDEIADDLQQLAADPDTPTDRLLRAALLSLVTLGRLRPHLYRLMFTTPAGDPTAAIQAAARAQALFVEIVTRRVGSGQARRYAGLLLTSAHGITDLELSGHLGQEKWNSTAESLVELLIGLLPKASGELQTRLTSSA